jgi:RNA polymerase sigma factor (sigma-70 family)
MRWPRNEPSILRTVSIWVPHPDEWLSSVETHSSADVVRVGGGDQWLFNRSARERFRPKRVDISPCRASLECPRGEERVVHAATDDGVAAGDSWSSVPGAALAEQHAAYYLRLVRLAAQLVDDQESAEDVVQEVFARLHANGFHVHPSDVLAYLRRAVINEARSTIRRRQVRRRWTPWHTLEVAPPADETTLQADDASSLLRLVDRLPRRQREIVVLKYYDDLATVEIADALGITTSAVTSSLNRALSALRSAMESHDDH